MAKQAELHTKENNGVRERLLHVALEVFAEQGFKKTTVRDICSRADVNVASVNYYFGSKQELYEEVCRYSCGASAGVPPVFPIDAHGAPEEKLRAFVQHFMRTILLQGATSLHGKIMAREMMEPTSALHIVVEELIKPRHEQISVIIREILGGEPDDMLVRRCCFSIAGQCLYYRFARVVARELQPGLSFDEETIREIAYHITLFTLHALRGIAREL